LLFFLEQILGVPEQKPVVERIDARVDAEHSDQGRHLTIMLSHKTATTDNKLTTADLMQKLRLSRRTICTWVRTGKLPAVRMPYGGYVFQMAEIDNWLAKHKNSNKG